jgi:hypothetical protein
MSVWHWPVGSPYASESPAMHRKRVHSTQPILPLQRSGPLQPCQVGSHVIAGMASPPYVHLPLFQCAASPSANVPWGMTHAVSCTPLSHGGCHRPPWHAVRTMLSAQHHGLFLAGSLVEVVQLGVLGVLQDMPRLWWQVSRQIRLLERLHRYFGQQLRRQHRLQVRCLAGEEPLISHWCSAGSKHVEGGE